MNPPIRSYLRALTLAVLTSAVAATASAQGSGPGSRAFDFCRAQVGRASVGVAGMHAARPVARQDGALAASAIPRMMEAVQGEASPAELEDERRVSIGRGHIHGTQFRREETNILLAGRLEDSVHVDMRREGAWLPPRAITACLAARAATTGR